MSFSLQNETLVPPPSDQISLPGSFWVISVFFNPSRCKNMLARYLKFQKMLKAQGVKLLCVELAFSSNNHAISEDQADILVRRRTQDILWHKERLLNIGYQNLPEDCDKFAWIDIDVKFEDDDWAWKTTKLLEQYRVIQPYSVVVNLLKGKISMEIENLDMGPNEGQKSFSIAYGVAHLGRHLLSNQYFSTNTARHVNGHPGYAWAARKSVFENLEFYDRLVLGSADALMAHGFFGNQECFLSSDTFSTPSMREDQLAWMSEAFKSVKGSVGHLDGVLSHTWHGSIKDRKFEERRTILKKFNFNPGADLKKDGNDCWTWGTQKPELHQWVEDYFWLRNEDGKFSIIIYNHIRMGYNFIKKIILRYHFKVPYILE